MELWVKIVAITSILVLLGSLATIDMDFSKFLDKIKKYF